jgi:hypothetical protein
MMESDGPFEDVMVFAIVGHGGIGTGDVEKVTQFREELLVVGSFGCGGVLPS